MAGRKFGLILNLTKSSVYKSGAIIPKYPVQQYVGELEFDELTLDLYYKEGKENQWCMKMHKMAMIKKGRYSFLTFQVTGKEKELNATIA
jgi:alpha-glucosidase